MANTAVLPTTYLWKRRLVLAVLVIFSLTHVVFPTASRTELAFDGVELMASPADAAFHREKILDRHNYLRSREAENGFGYGAVFMNRLVYDVGLEAYARNYARHLCATGKWEHSKRVVPLRVSRGENLYTNSVDYSTMQSKNFDSAQIIQKWWDERQYFDWHAESPSKVAQRQGKMVGHWTQVVRAEASTVGCWIVTGCQCTAGRSCQKANNGQWSTYMACHYDYGNLGHFPYWPLNPNIQYRMPSTVTQNRRQRCGSCPKGFNQCGTTVGGGEKRDAYLCAGYWNIHESMPPADLLRKSIATRHSATGIPSWYFMVRNCARGNGSCPSNSVCWAYERGKALTAEPPVLVNQCQCKGFSTQYGIYFERDMCGQYSSVQPYYDADAFLTFLEKKKSLDPLPSADALPSSDYPQAHTTEGTHLHSVSHPSAARSISTDGAFFQVGTPSEGEAIAQTPPLAETAEEATDLIILPEAQSSPTSIGHALSTHHGVYSMLNQLEDLLSRKTTPLADSVTAFLSVDEITQVKPPSDDLMFEWKNVDDPRSIARKPAHVNADEGSALQVSSNLRGISRHHIKGFSSPAKVTWDKLPSDGPDNIHVAHETLLTGKAISTPHARLAGQDEKFSVSAEEIVQEGPPLPDIVDAKASLGGAVVNVKAVQNEAREKNKTPLPIASEESSSQLHAVSASKGGRRTTQSPQQHLATSTIGFPPRL